LEEAPVERRRKEQGMARHSSGLTLVEALVALTVLVALLMLVVLITRPARQAAECKENVLGIYAALRTYASNWDGFTHPDPDYYVKLAGYKLRNEPGYDARKAARVTDFVCPSDAGPSENRHGYFSSYRVVGPFAGGNVMQIGHNRATLGIYEVGKRHLHPDSRGPSAFYLREDGWMFHGLGSYRPAGLRVRAWRNGADNWKAIKSGPLRQEPDYDGVWFRPYPDGVTWMRTVLSLGPRRPQSDEQDKGAEGVVWRWDGTIRLHGDEWDIKVQGGDWVFLWIDSNQDGVTQNAEVAERREGTPDEAFGRRWTIPKREGDWPYVRCTFMILRRGVDSSFRLSYARPNGNVETVPNRLLSYFPQE